MATKAQLKVFGATLDTVLENAGVTPEQYKAMPVQTKETLHWKELDGFHGYVVSAAVRTAYAE